MFSKLNEAFTPMSLYLHIRKKAYFIPPYCTLTVYPSLNDTVSVVTSQAYKITTMIITKFQKTRETNLSSDTLNIVKSLFSITVVDP